MLAFCASSAIASRTGRSGLPFLPTAPVIDNIKAPADHLDEDVGGFAFLRIGASSVASLSRSAMIAGSATRQARYR